MREQDNATFMQNNQNNAKNRGVAPTLSALALIVIMCAAMWVFSTSLGELTNQLSDTATPSSTLPYAPTLALPSPRPRSTIPYFSTRGPYSTPALNCRSEYVCNPMFVPGRGTTCIYTIQLVCDSIPANPYTPSAPTLTPAPTFTPSLTASPSATPSPTATSTPTPTATPAPLLAPRFATAGASLLVILICAGILVGIAVRSVRKPSA